MKFLGLNFISMYSKMSKIVLSTQFPNPKMVCAYTNQLITLANNKVYLFLHKMQNLKNRK